MSKATYKQLDLSGKIKETDLSEDTQSALNKTDLSSNNETVTFYCDCDSSSDVLDNDLISDYSNINSAISFSSVSDFDTTDIDSSDKKFGDASFNFNRSNYSLLIPKDGNINLDGKFSISVWIKVNGEVSRTIYSDVNGILKLIIDSDGKAKATLTYGNTDYSVTSTTSVNSNSWINIIVKGETNTFGSDSLSILINGTKENGISDQNIVVNENLSSNFILGSSFNVENSTLIDMDVLPSSDGMTFSGSDEFSDCSVSNGFLTIDTLTKGTRTAVYEKIWTPTVDSNLKLGLPCDFDGVSVEGKQPSVNTMVLDRTVKRFNRSSFYMNETNTHIQFSANSDWNVFSSLTDTWTLDFWIKTTKDTGNHIINQYDSNSIWRLFTNGSSEYLKLYVWGSGGDKLSISTGTFNIADDSWHHIAIVKVNADVAIYVDGIRRASGTLSGTVSVPSPLSIGSHDGSFRGQGNIDNIRITKSNPFSADPTSANNITIPSKTVFDTCYYETKVKLEQTDAGEKMPDNTGLLITADVNNDSEEGKSATHTTSLDTGDKKFGNSSLKFNGSSDYVSFADSNDWDIYGSLNDTYTIALWVKHTDHSGTEYYITQRESDADLWSVGHYDGTGLMMHLRKGDSTIFWIEGGEITDNDWHHVMFLIKGDGAQFELAAYLDGVQVTYSTSNVTTTLNSSLFVGKRGDDAGIFDGNIDDVIIAKTNIFSASPNSGKTDTIVVPTKSSKYTDGYLDYKISNGLNESEIRIKSNYVEMIGSSNIHYEIDSSYFNTYRHMLRGSKSYLFINGVLRLKNIASSTSNNKVSFGDSETSDGVNVKSIVENFRYNQQSNIHLYNNELNGNIDSIVVIDDLIIQDTIDQLQSAAGKDIAPGTRDGSQIRNVGNSHLAIQDLIDQREYEEATYLDVRDYTDSSSNNLSYYVQFSTKKRVVPTITTVIVDSTNLNSISTVPNRDGINFILATSNSGYVRWEGSWSAQCASIAKIYDITDTDFKCITGKPLFDSVGELSGYDSSEHTVLLSSVVKDNDSLTYTFSAGGVYFTIPMTNEEQKISWIYGLDSDHLSAQSLKLVQKLTDSSEYENIQSTLRTNNVNKKEIRNEFLKYYEKVKKIRTNIYTSLENFVLNNKELILSRIDAGEKYLQNGDL